jgi:uncharacterized protein (TIGR03083 family)
MSEWNFMDPASRGNLKTAIRREYEAMVEMASAPGAWENPTAAGEWQYRDIIGHLVAVTEGYFVSVDAARGNGEVTMRDVMNFSDDMDSDARALSRTLEKDELLARLDGDFNKMESIFDGLTDEEWGSLMVTHGHFGPMPVFMFAIFQLVDYGVHGWDMREGTGQRHAMDGATADLLSMLAIGLVPSMVHTDEDLKIGLEITSGPNAGGYTVSTGGPDAGASATPGIDDDVAATIECDPATLILTWYGRFNSGTIRGDQDAAHRLLNSIAMI